MNKLTKQINTMQTPINTLLDWANYRKDKSANSSKAAWNMIIDKATELLPYEQEYIEEREAAGFKSATNTTPIGFDVRQTAIDMYNRFYGDLPNYITEKDANDCVAIALTYSHFTQRQREEIINELSNL